MLYFIVNNASRAGRGKESWLMICEELKKREIEYKAFITKYEKHATKLAQQISSLPDDDICLVVVGGDGTINEVLNGITDFGKIRFAVISNGSGNDFARGMRLEQDPMKALEKILDMVEKGRDSYSPIDLGRVSWMDMEGDIQYDQDEQNEADEQDEADEQKGTMASRIFGISSGVGLDAIVCKNADTSKLKKVLNFLHMGSLTYVLYTVYALFSMKTAEMDAVYIKEDGETEEKHYKKMIFMASMNQFAEGGGVPMAPDASCRDGLLSFSSAAGIPKWLTFFCLPLLMAAKHQKLKGFDLRDAKQASFKISEPFVLHTDGEYCGMVQEVRYEVLEGVLKFLD